MSGTSVTEPVFLAFDGLAAPLIYEVLSSSEVTVADSVRSVLVVAWRDSAVVGVSHDVV